VLFWDVILKELPEIKAETFSEALEIQLKRFQKSETFLEASEEKKNKNEREEYKEVPSEETVPLEGTLLKNAGLILLHPFLKPFFEKLGFLSEKTIIPSKIDNAIHVLHYLATKEEHVFEHQLLLEKFLCEVPFNYPINRHLSLTKAQKEECNELHKSVLGHWTALKSSSPDILRNEFLKREGKLSISGEKHQLYIQRKPYDILLDKIPWNIGIVKIPWKKKVLFVEW
jgi:hypothetical protein